jgi:hypothetical protein
LRRANGRAVARPSANRACRCVVRIERAGPQGPRLTPSRQLDAARIMADLIVQEAQVKGGL